MRDERALPLAKGLFDRRFCIVDLGERGVRRIDVL
jgi:hypothetical protein